MIVSLIFFAFGCTVLLLELDWYRHEEAAFSWGGVLFGAGWTAWGLLGAYKPTGHYVEKLRSRRLTQRSILRKHSSQEETKHERP